MKKVIALMVFILIAAISNGQTDIKKKIDDPPKKGNNQEVKTVPKTQQNKTQIKKVQNQKNKTKQVSRKAKAIRRKKNG